MKLKTPTPKDVHNKTVIVRVDYNVPLEKKKGSQLLVADDNRIQRSLDTIRFLLKNKAKVILMSHLGRPKGAYTPGLSLEPVARHLEKLLDRKVFFANNPDEAAEALEEQNDLIVLENLRFDPGEKKNDAHFAQKLAKLADVYINEAFSTAHREHASVAAITKYLPSYAGIAFEKEIATLFELMTEPKRPFVMVIGGAKISDKVDAVVNLTKIADVVLVGGGVANNFLKAEGIDVARSYLQDVPADLKKKGVDYIKVAENLIEATKTEKLLKDDYIPLPKIIYPTDVLAASSTDAKTTTLVELVNGNHEHAMKQNLMYLDIGPKTIRLFKELILQAGTVFWNGPMGVFEKEPFQDGTKEIARAIAKSSATTIIGGGDTIAAISDLKLEDRYDYVSAAGGAALEFLSGKMLPGLKPLLKGKKH